ncbi:XcbB/CpsF family capsular polysaccharide biosynthesis protein [Enterococcus faecalis]|uniref:XcbB/CpsF family capsular polysaccharide biosynthesis protein n=1 Tax=Enterococcus faecalis TaxID=1351 RepID=UPI00325BCBD0
MNDLWGFLDQQPDFRQTIYEKAQQGYTVDGFIDNDLHFVKINDLNLNLKRYKNLHYSIELPEFNGFLCKKLVVLFTPATAPGSSSAKDRYFGTQQWNSLNAKVGKNVIILRIADVAFVSGSYYTLYEQEIFELIANTCAQFGLRHNDVVLYGNSRGGTGALFIGMAGNYKTVSADPVIDRTPWIYGHDGRYDRQLMYDFIEVDFSNRLRNIMRNNVYDSRNIYVIASEQNKVMFDSVAPLSYGLTLKNINLQNISTDMLKNPLWLHGVTINESVQLQLAMINYYLFN